jgi:hypothetical protein|tara:strand:- start:208 stop:384 length:177 start_codon:yes stop_codon:yes gene_type:complete
MNLDPALAGPPSNGIPVKAGITTETALEGAAEGTADVVSVPSLKAAATTTESPTETAF